MATSDITPTDIQTLLDDGESDYGSDFTPEEEQIVGQLLSARNATEDNPIVNDIEHHESNHTLRLPRILGREEMSPLLQAARAAEKVAQQLSESVKGNEGYPDCKFSFPSR
jgi:exonuclease V